MGPKRRQAFDRGAVTSIFMGLGRIPEARASYEEARQEPERTTANFAPTGTSLPGSAAIATAANNATNGVGGVADPGAMRVLQNWTQVLKAK